MKNPVEGESISPIWSAEMTITPQISRALPFLLMLAAAVLLACQSAPEPDGAEERTAESQKRSVSLDEKAEADEMVEEPAAEPTEEERRIAERITDRDLEMFALGVRAVAERERQLEMEQRDFETRREQAASPAEVVQIQEEVLQEFEEALAEEGIEWEGFMRMGGLIRNNPILMERLGDHLTDDEIDNFYGGTD